VTQIEQISVSAIFYNASYVRYGFFVMEDPDTMHRGEETTMQSNRPNLFLIGAMKSGTSSLHAQLGRHPQVFMSAPKEPCWFVDPEYLRHSWPEMWERGYWKSQAAYLELFADADGRAVIGESSTDYTKRPAIDGVVEKIASFNPDARFIYIMRDPVQRSLSHYWHMVEHRGERRGLLEALQNDPAYRQVSYYAMQLTPYLEHFGPERMYALTFEEYLADPAAVVRRIFTWLGVDLTVAAADPDMERRNSTPETVLQERGMGLLNRLRYSSAWSAVENWVPAPVRRFGRSLAQRPVRRADVSKKREAMDFLRPSQLIETEELRDLLSRDFPEWKTLYAENRAGGGQG
jgi:hypothetical protein